MATAPTEPEEDKLAMHEGETDGDATFVFKDEDHTLGNALRYCLIKNRKVDFCGYSIPHPSEPSMNLRIQAAVGGDGEPVATAPELLNEGLNDLHKVCQHVLDRFDAQVEAYPGDDPSE